MTAQPTGTVTPDSRATSAHSCRCRAFVADERTRLGARNGHGRLDPEVELRSGKPGKMNAMPGPLRIRGSVVIPEAELSWRFSRASGPGGQSVNTTDSRVELSYDVAASAALGPTLKTRALQRLAGRLANGVLTVTASEHRSQLRNRKAAELRLAQMLEQAIAPPPRRRRPTKPSRASVERRLAIKRRRSDSKRLRRAVED